MKPEDSFWAKKSDKIGVFQWLPLKQHLIDTMQISGLLWEHWLSNGQKRFIVNSLSIQNEEVAKRLVKFLGIVHDLGKATPAFQTKQNYHPELHELDSILIDKLEQAGFSKISDLCLPNRIRSHHALASEALLKHYGVGADIASIAGAHHGKPSDDEIIINIQLKSYDINYYQVENPNNPIHEKWKTAQESILKWALEESKFHYVENLPIIGKSAQIILSGLLIMADWIASNKSYFPLISAENSGDNFDQKQRLRVGWNTWFKTHPWEPKTNEDCERLYIDRFNINPREVQAKLAKAIQDSKNPGIFIVEAPMGIGKTEAALIAVEQLCAKTGRSGMFFGLPTQATSNGIFTRVKKWLENIAASENEIESLRLVHGKASLNHEFANLASNVDIDGGQESGVIANAWFAGKKTAILDDFVVGTVDHFLLAALKQKHLAMRHLGLSKKVVVIDEVHAYDAYMGQYLYQAIRWMGAYGTPVIILSATLPASRRKELIEAYIRGSGRKVKDCQKKEGWETSTAYPLITSFDGDTIKQQTDFSILENKAVEIKKIAKEQIAEILKDLLQGGGVAGIVVNTVKRAQELAEELSSQFGEEVVELLHSAFIYHHRIEKEEQLLAMIGKGAERPHRKIIVGTQVIEQSLDIDFDVLFSELSPMDLLIQRAGRLHRHELPWRPERLKTPALYIMGTDENFEFEKGSSYVYGNYLLMRTQTFLPETINLPSDISPLVQQTYSDDELELKGEVQDKYRKAMIDMTNLIHNKKTKADSYLLENPQKVSTHEKYLVGWLKNSNPEDSEEKGFAQVRDSGDSIEVIVVKKCGEGYGFYDETGDISQKINDNEIEKKLASQTLKLPNALCAAYKIDETIEYLEKMNKKYFPDWQQNIWLKGALGIILDENNSTIVNGWKLYYDKKYGLRYEKEAKNGKI